VAWTNWSGTVHCEPTGIERPGSEEEIARLVHRAAAEGTTLRVVGSGHSHTPLVATPGIIASIEAHAGIETVDRPTLRTTVRAGSVLSSLGPALRDHGLAMENLGDVDVQSLAGALSTGTHGTGRRLGGLATQVEALRLVTANGEIVSCSRNVEPRLFESARVALGALGVLTSVTLRLVPAYRLHERLLREDAETCLARFDERADAHRHCEFFWLPGKDLCEVKLLDATDAAPDPLTDHPYERIDHSDRVLPSARELRFVEMEYALPVAAGPACFRELRALMRSRHPAVQWPVEYRSVAADPIPLSPAHARDTVTISLHQGNTLPFEAFFADAESILRTHGGRPHWGKWHTLGADALRDLYPRFQDFLALRAELDPAGLFLNPHLRRIFGLDDRPT
jgi:FAD/FMN-containing dehydrogenase